MKFISHIRKYQVGILTPMSEVLPGGLVREIVPLLVAQFEQGDLSAEELEFAERRFAREAHGRTQEQDEVTLVPIIGRLSSYDTQNPANQAEYEKIDQAMMGREHPDLARGEKWDYGSTQKIVERKLLKRAETSDAFALFEKAPEVPPWPAYDQFPGTIEDLVEVLVAQQHHLPQVLSYERENQNRPDLVALLEERIDAQLADAGVTDKDAFISA